MDKPIIIDETKTFDPQLEDLSSYLARIRSAAIRQAVEPIDCSSLSTSVLAVLRKLEEIYAP